MKRLLSVKETAELLGLAERTIYNGVAPKSSHSFPVRPVRVGKAVRFDLKDLEKYIEGLKG